MKLLQKYDKHEGEEYPKNVFITFGKQVGSKETGWFIKLTFPLTLNKPHICPRSFEPTKGPMRYSVLYRRRPANDFRKSMGYLIKGWFPL